MKRLTPKRYRSGTGFWVQFRDPRKSGAVVQGGLATNDEAEALKAADDLSYFLNNFERFCGADPQRDAQAAVDSGYHPAAVRIWFGVSAIPGARAIDPWEITVKRFRAANKDAEKFFGEHVPALEKQAGQLPVLMRRIEELEDELLKLRRAHNQHVKIRLADAVSIWKPFYAQGHSKRTTWHAHDAVDTFLNWAAAQHGEKWMLGSIRATDIDEWISQCRKKTRCDADGEPLPSEDLHPESKKRLRAYVSVFFSWACKKYDLSENPMAKSAVVPGADRSAEDIRAVRSPEEIAELLDALKPWPYWRAFVAVSMFSGPRWGELCRLRIGDVRLKERYIRYNATKTGRQRSTPIERTTLLPILREHMERRAAERGGDAAAMPLFGAEPVPQGLREALSTDLVFPSTLNKGVRARVETAVGVWSSSSNFFDEWRGIRLAAWARASGVDTSDPKAIIPPLPEHWSLGPREWRHCGGMTMGHAGYSSLQISQWLGNSEDIARRHYIPPIASEKWPFEW